MIDLARIVGQFELGREASIGDPEGQELGIFPNDQFGQDTEKIDISLISQFPTDLQETYKAIGVPIENKHVEISDQRSARDAYACDVGNVGNQGKAKENNATSFPLDTYKLGNWEKEGSGAASAPSTGVPRPILDLNRAGPQRSDWWDEGTLSALAPQLAPTAPASEPLPISSADVRAGVERELRALAVLGRTGAAAQRDAIEITRAKVRNAPVLAERQLDGGRCHVCEEVLDDALPVIAILTGKSGAHLFVHSKCHDEHRRRVSALVERVMAGAGYGADEPTGAAF